MRGVPPTKKPTNTFWGAGGFPRQEKVIFDHKKIIMGGAGGPPKKESDLNENFASIKFFSSILFAPEYNLNSSGRWLWSRLHFLIFSGEQF